MYGCESWTIKKAERRKIDGFELWCWRRLLSPLDCKEIKPVSPKGNQSWNSIRSWNSNTKATFGEELTHRKRPWCWERLKAGGEGDDRGRDGWMASPTQWTWVWAASGVGDGHGSLACCSPWDCKESDTTERLTWTESLGNTSYISSGYQLLNCSATLLLTHLDQGPLLPLCYTVWNWASIPQPQTSYEFQMKRVILQILRM